MEDHAARAGRRLKLRVRLPDFDGVCQVVGSGVGVAVVPATAARRYRRSGAFRIIPLTDTWAPRRLTICVRSFAALPPPDKGSSSISGRRCDRLSSVLLKSDFASSALSGIARLPILLLEETEIARLSPALLSGIGE
jgi:LysR substrate binding domain